MYKNLHSVDLWPNSGTLGHFQTWHPPIFFLKHIKIHFEYACQNVLKMPTDFFSGSGWPTIWHDHLELAKTKAWLRINIMRRLKF